MRIGGYSILGREMSPAPNVVNYTREARIKRVAKKQYLWKALKAGLKSNHDGSSWKIGEWRHVPPPDERCIGLNASLRIVDAILYAETEILAKVEVGGKIIKGDNKYTCERMRIVQAYAWTKEESTKLVAVTSEIVYYAFKMAPIEVREASAGTVAAVVCAASAAEITGPTASRTAWEMAVTTLWYAMFAAKSLVKDDTILNEIEAYLLKRIKYLKPYKENKRVNNELVADWWEERKKDQ